MAIIKKRQNDILYTMFRFLISFSLVTCVLTSINGRAEESKKLNIVVIVTDDQHRIDFNFLPEGRFENGKSQNFTPNIDKLANEGIIFDQMYATSSVCTPSRYSVLTGDYASRAKNKRFVNDLEKYQQSNVAFNTHIEPHNDNIASTLKQAGYFTGAVGKNHVIESEKPFKINRYANVKLPEVIRQLKANQQAQKEAFYKVGFDFADRLYAGNVPGQYPIGLEAHNQDWITEGALNFLDLAATKQQPFFLYFATTLEHGPHRQGQKYLGDPSMTPIGLLSPEDIPKVQPSRASISERIQQQGLEQRAADVLWLDDAIGALLDKLEQTERLSNTVIFYFNDHGVEGGKGSLYQSGTLTPAFVWFGNETYGSRRISDLVANIDIAPTIYQLAGIEKPPQTDGQSMVPLLKGENEHWRTALVSELGVTRSVIKDGWKYIAMRVPQEKLEMPLAERRKLAQSRNRNQTELPWMHMGGTPGGRSLESLVLSNKGPDIYFARDQLFNYIADPKEKNNLINKPEYQATLNELKTILKTELNKRPGGFAEFAEHTKVEH